MGVFRGHIPYYSDVLALDGFLRDPVLVFGFQDCGYGPEPSVFTNFRRTCRYWMRQQRWGLQARAIRRPVPVIPGAFQAEDFQKVLRNYGANDIVTLDAFDKRATILHDMNTPVSASMHGGYNTVLDMGSMEHVFDTRQCMENLFWMLKDGGHILFHVACRGHFDHGLHTFSPECIVGALRENGFELRYLAYSSPDGYLLRAPVLDDDAIMWVVGRKVKSVAPFVPPQQTRWLKWYKGEAQSIEKWFFDLTEGRMDGTFPGPLTSR